MRILLEFLYGKPPRILDHYYYEYYLLSLKPRGIPRFWIPMINIKENVFFIPVAKNMDIVLYEPSNDTINMPVEFVLKEHIYY